MGRLDGEYRLPEIAHFNTLSQRDNRTTLGSPHPDADFGKFIPFLEDDLKLVPKHVELGNAFWVTYFGPQVGIKVFRGETSDIALGAAFRYPELDEEQPAGAKFRNMLLWAAPVPKEGEKPATPLITPDQLESDISRISAYFIRPLPYFGLSGGSNESIAIWLGMRAGALLGTGAAVLRSQEWSGILGDAFLGLAFGGVIGKAAHAGIEKWHEAEIPRLDQYLADMQAVSILEHIQAQVQRVTVQTEFDQAWASHSRVELARDEVLRLYDRVAERTQGELFERRLEEIDVARHPEKYGDIIIEMGAIDAMVAVAGDINNELAGIWEIKHRSIKSTAATMHRVRRNAIIVN